MKDSSLIIVLITVRFFDITQDRPEGPPITVRPEGPPRLCVGGRLEG